MQKRYLARFMGVLCFMCAFPLACFGYLDPGSGSLLLSSIVALFASFIFFIKNLFYKLIALPFGIKMPKNSSSVAQSIIFYCEGKTYYPTFKPILDALDRLSHPYTYYTSDESDPALSRERSTNAHFSYIGKGNKAYNVLNRLKADICVLTTPGLDVLHIKRNKGVKHYCHIVHSLTPMTYRAFGVDYFDSVLVANAIQKDFIREIESAHKVKAKYIGVTGSTYLDELAGLSASGKQCDKILDFPQGTDAKSANLAKNPKSLHSPTANLRMLDSQSQSLESSNPNEANQTQDTSIADSCDLESQADSQPRHCEAVPSTTKQSTLANATDPHLHTSDSVIPQGQNLRMLDSQSQSLETCNPNEANRTQDSSTAELRVDSKPCHTERVPSTTEVSRTNTQSQSPACRPMTLQKGEVSHTIDSVSTHSNKPRKSPTILISPSWGKESLLSKYGLELLLPLAQSGFSVIIRPHPQSLIGKEESANLAFLQDSLKDYRNITWDIGTANVYAFKAADMMISDFSSVIFDFVCLESKPVLTVENAMDLSGYDMADIPKERIWTFGALERIGGRLKPSDFPRIKSICENLLVSATYLGEIKQLLWQHPHNAGEVAAREILKIERQLLESRLAPYKMELSRIRELDSMLERSQEAEHAS